MNDAFFQMASDFMAVSPAGSAEWTSINPALAARLGMADMDAGSVHHVDSSDPSRLTARDGSCVRVNWVIREEHGLSLWVGREATASLVRELHHGLKNNLQFVLSLLKFHSVRLQTGEARSEFARAESRILAVARLYESAYSSSDFRDVEFGAYLRELVRGLVSGEPVEISLQATDLILPMRQAMALAVIAHDLVCFAMEVAVASPILVSLQYDEQRGATLMVQERVEREATQIEAGKLELAELLVEELHGTLSLFPNKDILLAVSFHVKD